MKTKDMAKHGRQQTGEEGVNQEMASQEILKEIENLGVSQRVLSSACGVSITTMNQYLKGTYTGNTQKIEAGVKNFLEREREKSSAPKRSFAFVPTSGTKRGFDTARSCHLYAELGVLFGEAGSGKTETVLQYVKRHPDAILIEADLGFTAKILFRKLHESLGFDGKGSVHELFEDVVEKLSGSGRMIIVDEAEYLPHRALEMLRRVYDKAGIGVLLVGLPRLVMNLRGKRGEFAQLYSRVDIATKMLPLDEEDTENIVHAAFPSSNGISQDFHALSSGNARRLVKMMNRAQRLTEINSCSLSKKTVKAAFDMLVV